jgi:glycosyltransferase involved in cell wall biosynthesis
LSRDFRLVRRAERRLKLLFLLPFAPDLRGSHGGTRACAEMIAMLASHHRVRALYLAPDGEPSPRQLPPGAQSIEAVPITRQTTKMRGPFMRVLAALARGAWGRPAWVEEAGSGAVANRVAEVAAEFQPDVVHCEYHVMAQYIPTIRSAAPRAKCLVTEQEPGIVAGVRAGAKPSLRRRLGDALRRRSWADYERRTLRLADAVIAFTQSDADALRALLGRHGPKIEVIRLRVSRADPPSTPAKSRVKSDFLFVGNFMHPPNVDAATRLVTSIFPLISEELPATTLMIVGPNPPRELSRVASDRVTITGWVDDPGPYLAGASVVVVPLRQGGGLRVKMLEACAAGKAIIASPTAVEGLELVPDEHFILAESDEEFARAAVALIGDSGLRARRGKAARLWAEEAQDQDAWASEYAALYDSLNQGRGGGARPS